jgi:hypothetical protein
MVRPMMIMELEIRESNIYCDLTDYETHKTIADLRAEQQGAMWAVTSSTHSDSKALHIFEASDQWIATALLIGMARRLYQRIEDGEEE